MKYLHLLRLLRPTGSWQAQLHLQLFTEVSLPMLPAPRSDEDHIGGAHHKGGIVVAQVPALHWLCSMQRGGY